MVIKYDLQIYKGKKKVFFMFTLDHDIEFVETFVGGFYGVNQLKRIRGFINGTSVNDNLIGKYYDCNKFEQLLNPKIVGLNRDFAIVGNNFSLEFLIHDYNLNKIDYEEFVNTMEDLITHSKYEIMLIFCSAEDEHNKARYAGGVGIKDIRFNKEHLSP